MHMFLPGFTNLDGFYKDKLLNDVIPFWMKYSLDEEYGGFIWLCPIIPVKIEKWMAFMVKYILWKF